MTEDNKKYLLSPQIYI